MTRSDTAAALAAVGVIVGCSWVMAWALLRAADRPHRTAIVIALAIITLVLIVAALIADDPMALQFLTLAGTAVGAIAGAVTSTTTTKTTTKKEAEDDDHDPDTDG